MFLPVSSDVQMLELIYKLYPQLVSQRVSLATCPDISLGLSETRALSAVLTAQPTLLQLKDTIVTLRCINVRVSDVALVKLEPTQEMKLGCDGDGAIIDALPLSLSAKTPYGNLVQHWIVRRLELVLGALGISELSVELATDAYKALTHIVKLRAYGRGSTGYSKTLAVGGVRLV